MTSLTEATEGSLGAEENSLKVKDPMSAETEPSAGTAQNEMEPEMGVQAGTDGSEAKVMLPSDEKDRATRTKTEELTGGDELPSARLGWSAYNTRRVSGLFGVAKHSMHLSAQ